MKNKIYCSLISAFELSASLDDPSLIIIDCRFDLFNSEKGHDDFIQSHIPGARYAHLDRDLASRITQDTGRHPLPTMIHFFETLTAWGITPSKQVVVYDANGGSFAARLWWMLQSIGHKNVAVLDGGFPFWQSLGYPTVNESQSNPRGSYSSPDSLRWSLTASTEDVDKIRSNPDFRLIDARSPERFHGQVEPIDSIAGHIPGALNRFHGDNLQSDGMFKSPAVLRLEFESILKGVSPQNTIVYCGSGVTSCHHILAMQISDLPGARVYIGSWSQWIRDSNRPVAKF